MLADNGLARGKKSEIKKDLEGAQKLIGVVCNYLEVVRLRSK